MTKLRLKKNKGMTLISLVVTIIILIILAAVTIRLVLGDNGIINKAQTAADETTKEAATEAMNFKITNAQIETYGKEQRMPTLQELADDFCEDEDFEYVELATKKTASLSKIEVGENESIFTKLKEYPYDFEINSSLQLASIDGVQVATSDTITIDKDELKTLIAEEVEKQVNTIQPFQMEKIGETGSTSFIEIDIPEGIDQYRYLYFAFGNANEIYSTYIENVEEFKEHNSTSSTFRLYFYNNVKNQYAYFYYSDENTICAKVTGYNCIIYGIK